MLILRPLPFYTAFIQKSTSGIFLHHSSPLRSFYTRTCAQNKKKLKNPNRLAKRWRVFQRRRFWPFSGRSTTFCAASIGHFKTGIQAKNFQAKSRKDPDDKLGISSSHFDGQYPPFLSKQTQLNQKHDVQIEKPFLRKFMYNKHSQSKKKKKKRKNESPYPETTQLCSKKVEA